MMISKEQLYSDIEHSLVRMAEQGYDTEAKASQLHKIPFSYDALIAFAQALDSTPMRSDYPYEEPSDEEALFAALPGASMLPTDISLKEAKKKVYAAFLSSVCGCVLGKPLEINPSLSMLKTAFAPLGEWPICDYISVEMLDSLGKRHESYTHTCRENIRYAAADDDINYSVLGMLLLERHGLSFTHADIALLWGERLPVLYTFGPERRILRRMVTQDDTPRFLPSRPEWLNPGNEYCGAMIRADAYGYACPGNPKLAAALAYRDASFTHQKTGIYGAMFAAAAIAQAFVAKSPMEIFEVALQFVPPKSRFYEKVAATLSPIEKAGSFEAGYAALHESLSEFTHCRIYQEAATLINTLCYATDIGDGIAKQVMQGNDTDSYGCTAGSILGAYFGPDYLDERWYRPFDDRIQLGIACAPEHSLSALARRMGNLPGLTLS